MKKTYYTFFTLSVVAIFVLQSLFIRNLHSNFINKKGDIIENCLLQAIDLEIDNRENTLKSSDYSYSIISVEDMSKELLDSLLKAHPLPTEFSEKNLLKKPVSYNVKELIEKGVVKSKAQVETHLVQDREYEKGNPINIQILDSIFTKQIGSNFQHKIEIRDKNDTLLQYIGNSKGYNYSLKPIQIGMKEYQFVSIFAKIPLSSFIKSSFIILFLSFLVISIPLLSLVYLLTTIKSKQLQLTTREQSINGIIHDLKSPLGSVKTMLSFLKITESDNLKRDMINNNSVAITHLIKKVELLLEVSRYNKSKIMVIKNEVSVIDLIESSKLFIDSLLYSYMDKKNCDISISYDIDKDKIIHIDNSHFETIINNLIENSIKYSNFDVKIDLFITLDDKNYLQIIVKDNGIGIEKRYQKLIFKQFFRIPNNKIKGHGIGLSYLRAIAIAHGGNINVESDFGSGSKFCVTLNCSKDND